MEGFTPYSDADRELDELRRRAYGRHPDIGVDLMALARLRELEAAHRAELQGRADATTDGRSAAGSGVASTAVPRTGASDGDGVAPDRPRSADAAPEPVQDGWLLSWLRTLVQRATATPRSRLAWGLGVLVVGGGIVATSAFIASRPDATLRLTAATADERVRRLVIEQSPWLDIDTSTLHAYGSFLGLEIWSGLNAFHSPCLVAVHRANDTLSESRCAPPAADLIMDVSSSGDGFEGFEGRPGDGIIRFVLRDDTVDAYVHLMPESD